MAAQKNAAENQGGAPVNTAGSSQYSDPSWNVLQLVNAQVVRLNDLRDKDDACLKETLRLNEIILNLHVTYGEKLSLAESKRIDAIRAVDVGAVGIASERASAQAQVLANQVSASAETLRNLVATTAATAAQQFQQVTTAASQQFQQVTSQLSERISTLEKSQYESKGLSGLPPEILTRMAALERGESRVEGKGLGIDKLIYIILAVATIVTLVLKFT